MKTVLWSKGEPILGNRKTILIVSGIIGICLIVGIGFINVENEESSKLDEQVISEEPVEPSHDEVRDLLMSQLSEKYGSDFKIKATAIPWGYAGGAYITYVYEESEPDIVFDTYQNTEGELLKDYRLWRTACYTAGNIVSKAAEPISDRSIVYWEFRNTANMLDLSNRTFEEYTAEGSGFSGKAVIRIKMSEKVSEESLKELVRTVAENIPLRGIDVYIYALNEEDFDVLMSRQWQIQIGKKKADDMSVFSNYTREFHLQYFDTGVIQFEQVR